MGEQTAIHRDGTWLTPLAGLCLGLALVAAAVLLTAALGYRTSALGLGAAFDLLRWGAYGGATAASVSLLAILLIAVRGVGAGRLAVASLALVIGGVSYWLPAQQRNTAFASPPIHDITTDTDDPPCLSPSYRFAPTRLIRPNTIPASPRSKKTPTQTWCPFPWMCHRLRRSTEHSRRLKAWAGRWSLPTKMLAASRRQTRPSGSDSRTTSWCASGHPTAAAVSMSGPNRASVGATSERMPRGFALTGSS